MKRSDLLKSIIHYKDVCMGSVMFFVFAGIFFSADNIRLLSVVVDIGPRFFPKLVSIFGGILSLLIIKDGLQSSKRKKRDAKQISEQKESEDMPNIGASLFSLANVIVYMLILERVGYIVASCIFLLLQSFLLASDKQRKSKKSLIVILCMSIIVPVIVFIAFRYGFYLMLPSGTLFR